jgi:hypothetical protein
MIQQNFCKESGVQRTESFGGVRSHTSVECVTSQNFCKESGVQRTESFAGVRGVPEKLLLHLLPPQAAKEKPAEQVSTINPYANKIYNRR